MAKAPKPAGVVENAIIPDGLDLEYENGPHIPAVDRGRMTLHFGELQLGPRAARGAVEYFAAELVRILPPAECPWPKYESARGSLWNLHCRLYMRGTNAAGQPYPVRERGA